MELLRWSEVEVVDDIGYIRDDGTLSSLALIGGEYYNRAMFTPNQLVELIEEIDKTYEPNKIETQTLIT